jgi:NAD(P)H-dependent FMN reductase
MARIVGIAGSLRKASFNVSLLRAAQRVAPADLQVEIASIRGVPPFDADQEAAGFPEAVTALKETLATADGLLLVTPEYNGSVPGVLKNAIDWMSRPASDMGRVFGGKPVGHLGATPGMGGTRLSQAAWLPIFRVLEMRPFFGKQLYVAGAAKVFDDSGALVDAKVEGLLTAYMAAFSSFVASGR